MSPSEIALFKTNGTYLGFTRGGFLYSRDGDYLGWLDGQFVWDANGNYRGVLLEIGGNNYVVLNKLGIPPVQRQPKSLPAAIAPLPEPRQKIAPIQLPIGFTDSF